MSIHDAGAANYAQGSGNLEARASIWSYADQPAGAPPVPLGWFCDLVDWTDITVTADIGCGSGRYLPFLQQRSAHVVGLDYSTAMLTELHLRTTCPLTAGDVCRLPFRDDSLDRILAAWMLYHAPDPDLACAELRRTLRPRGTLIAVTNAATHTHELDDYWNAAVASLGGAESGRPRLPVNGFALDDAAETLSRHFASVEMHVRRTRLRIPEPTPVITYLSSLRDYVDTELADHHLDFDTITPALTAVLDTQIEKHGFIRITGLTAAIICS